MFSFCGICSDSICFLKGLLFIKVEDLREARSLTLKGFRSVDENLTLLALYPTKLVEHNGVDLNESIKAGPHPSTLGRKLRRTLFGEDGQNEDMIESENSPNRKEAKTELCMIFRGERFVPLKIFFTLIQFSRLDVLQPLKDFLQILSHINFVLDLVEQKYPLTPRLAYMKTKMAANQAGLERRSFLNRKDNLVADESEQRMEDEANELDVVS